MRAIGVEVGGEPLEHVGNLLGCRERQTSASDELRVTAAVEIRPPGSPHASASRSAFEHGSSRLAAR